MGSESKTKPSGTQRSGVNPASILQDLRPWMRIGVDRFQATGADVGINFRRCHGGTK